MGILSRFRAAWKAISGAQLVVEPYFKTVSFSQFTQEETAQDLLKHFVHWVYICVTKNANAMASIPLKLYVTTDTGENQYKYLRKGIDTRTISKLKFKELLSNPLNNIKLTKAINTEEVVEHPFLDLWSKVNPFMNGFEMVKFIAHYLLLTGDAFLYAPKDGLGIPSELWVLPSQYVKVVPDKKEFIKGYIYGSNMQNATALEPKEVIHFKFTNPFDIFKGFSPVQGGMSGVKRKEDMDAYEDSLLRNNARPDFLILAKKKMNQADKLALREQWQQLYGSKQGRGRPALLDTDAEIKELGFSPKDIAFVQGQLYTKEEICGAFGVPVSKVTPNAKYSNAESGDREWKSDTIKPLLTLISDKLNEDLVPAFDTRLFAAFDNPVPEDKEFELRREEIYLRNGVITINEVREPNGLEIVSWGHVPIMPMNMYPMGTAPEPTMGTTEELSLKSKFAKQTNKKVKQYRRPPFVKLEDMKRIMRRVYKGMEDEVLSKLRDGKSVKQTAEETFYWMFNEQIWIEEVAELMGPAIKSQLITSAQWGIDRIGVGLRFDVMNPAVQEWLRNYTAHFSHITTRSMGLRFSRTMLEGIESGETIFELRKRTEEFFGRMKLYQSETIARAESSRAAHNGMIRGWQETGVVRGKIWRTQSGACQFCQEMEGKFVELENNYFEQGSSITGSDGGVMNLAYEEVSGPPLHPNCECTLEAVLVE